MLFVCMPPWMLVVRTVSVAYHLASCNAPPKVGILKIIIIIIYSFGW